MKTLFVMCACLSIIAGCASSASPSYNGGAECERYVSVVCSREIACAIEASLDGCRATAAKEGLDCSAPPWSDTNVNPSVTEPCLYDVHAMSCADIKDPNVALPASCRTWASQYKK